MKFNNLPNEIYSRIVEYLDSQQDVYKLMTVCKASLLPAKKRYYAQVRLSSNHQSFLTFLKNVQGGITPRYIKALRISDSRGRYLEPYTSGEFIYIIQSLKGLKTLELGGRQTKQYLDIMVNNIQIEDMKQIKLIAISTKSRNAETMEPYFKLIYKLRETITNFSFFGNIPGQPQRINTRYLSELKSLTHLNINGSFLRDTILRLCPKLQNLILKQHYGTPPLPPSKKLMVYNNLKRLCLDLSEFPRHYVTYIMSCIPPTIDYFRLHVRDDEKNWICSGFAETMLVDQFLAHLSKIKDMSLSLERIRQQRTHSGDIDLMARTWHFANSIRGRREKMITKADIRPISCIEGDVWDPLEFWVREYKYFDFSTTLYVNNEILEDAPKNDMEGLTMINSIKIKPVSNICILQFLRYIVKRCTRLSRIFILNINSLDAYSIVFAPIAIRSYQEEETALPLGYVTTLTEENILFASYSCMSIDESFLQSISQMFPKIKAVSIAGCDFEEPIIRIDLRGLEHLRRIELDPKQIYQKESVLFEVHLEHYGTVNYFFRRLIQGHPNIMGSFELISKSEDWQEKEDCIVISIFCFKVE
jgi:hypothetical protein